MGYEDIFSEKFKGVGIFYILGEIPPPPGNRKFPPEILPKMLIPKTF